MDKLFRYQVDGNDYELELRLRLLEFPIIKNTPCGYWIACSWFKNGKKWVSGQTRKRYAYPTTQEARRNYIKRTQRYISILKGKLKVAEEGLKIAKGER